MFHISNFINLNILLFLLFIYYFGLLCRWNKTFEEMSFFSCFILHSPIRPILWTWYLRNDVPYILKNHNHTWRIHVATSIVLCQSTYILLIFGFGWVLLPHWPKFSIVNLGVYCIWTGMNVKCNFSLKLRAIQLLDSNVGCFVSVPFL